MKISYDMDVDVLRILFSDTPIEYSEDVVDGFTLDYSEDGQIVGLEMLDASKRVDNPFSTAFAVIGKNIPQK
jgi:uncharacterized protein YuzE